ncbi:MAG: M20/M25/M40 family metallo-hydrolase [Deltaproteobacteria bacterium]|nr:M20/M25/M40 family metallo-hydrolase [Deltaproteobacteria bacterium]
MSELSALFDELHALTAVPSTSGFEQRIVKKIYSEAKPFADRIEVDSFGNVYAYLVGESEAFQVMLPAHSDSVGMITSHIEPDGYVRIDSIGMVPPNLIYGQRVGIVTPDGERTGVAGTKPGHLAYNTPMANEIPVVDALFIDVGATSQAEAEAMGIAPGQQVVFDRELKWLGDPSTGLVTGRSLDDKVGCLVILQTLKRLKEKGKKPPCTLVFVAAVQEEIGLRGAQQAGQRIRPDMCIGVDATISQAGSGTGVAPMPATTFSEAANALGKGPGLSVYDYSFRAGKGLMGHPKLIAFLKSVAEQNKIPFQIEGSMPGITSDAASVQFAGSGVPSITVKVPSRYTHGPVEVCSLHDIQATIDLLVNALPRITPDIDLSFVDLGNM